MRRHDYTGKTCRSRGGSHVDVISSEFTAFTAAATAAITRNTLSTFVTFGGDRKIVDPNERYADVTIVHSESEKDKT